MRRILAICYQIKNEKSLILVRRCRNKCHVWREWWWTEI